MNDNVKTTTNVDMDVVTVKKDRMRFSKNKLPSSLTLLAILINVFYFVSIYKSNVRYYYTPTMFLSVVYNLIFMLACFLCSEGIKNYKPAYGIVLIVVGALQILRIVYYPLKAHATPVNAESQKMVMETAQFIRVIIYLIASGVTLIAAGVIGVIRSKILADYRKTIGEEQPS